MSANLELEVRDLKRRLSALETSARVPQVTRDGLTYNVGEAGVGAGDWALSGGVPYDAFEGEQLWSPTYVPDFPDDGLPPFIWPFRMHESGLAVVHYSAPDLRFVGGGADTEVYFGLWLHRLPDAFDPYDFEYPGDFAAPERGQPVNHLPGFDVDEPWPEPTSVDTFWIRGDGVAKTSGFTFFGREPGWYTVELAATYVGTAPTSASTGWYTAMVLPQ